MDAVNLVLNDVFLAMAVGGIYWFFRQKRGVSNVVVDVPEAETPPPARYRSQNAAILRIRGNYEHKYITVDLGKIGEDSKLVQGYMKIIAVHIPDELPESHLANGSDVSDLKQVPDEWLEHILHLPEAHLT